MKKKVIKIQRATARLLLLVITVVILAQLSLTLIKFNVTVERTQWQLADVASQLRIYNALDVKTNADTELAQKLMDKRDALSLNSDPVVSTVAKFGFSIVIFIGVPLISFMIAFVVWTFVILNWRIIVNVEKFAIIAVLSVAIKPLVILAYYLYACFFKAEDALVCSRQRRYAKMKQRISRRHKNRAL